MTMRGLTAAGLAVAALMGTVTAAAQQPDEAKAGKRIFIRCVACHTLSADAPPLTGPHLEGIVGRQVATVPGFQYSEMMRAQTFTWDEAQLDRWLKHPQEGFPGLCLPFTGLPKPEDRKALIAYLKNPGS